MTSGGVCSCASKLEETAVLATTGKLKTLDHVASEAAVLDGRDV